MVLMTAQLLVVTDCPQTAPALALFRSALAHADRPTDIAVVVVDDEASARLHRFTGSPSFFLDGVDLLPGEGDPPAVACRMYRDPAGRPTGLPDAGELADALAARPPEAP